MTQPARRVPFSQAPSDPALLNRRGLLGLTAAGLAGAACRVTRSGTRGGRGHGLGNEPSPPGHGSGVEAGAPTSARDQLDELFVDLVDQRGSVTAISDSERAARRRRLGDLLALAGFDAFLVEPGATMSYLSAVSWGLSERLFALVVLADGSHFWVAPAFEKERAELSIARGDDAGPGPVVTWEEHEYAFAPLASALRERRVERLAVEPSVRYRFADGIARELGAERVAIGTEVLVELRGRKDEHELALMRRANELTQAAIAAVAATLEPGLSERDVGARLRRAQERLGLSRVWNLSLIGPSAAYPHGDGRNTELGRGDLLLVDTGGSLHGYSSDISRTWIVDGKPDAKIEKAWNTVRDAQRVAYETIRPGIPCKRIDQVARAWIEDHGYGAGYRHFTHRLGHGIGMQGHEDPYFDGGSEVILAEGMTFSDEPGIYVYGEFGVRLEDIVAVSAEGADHFGNWQSSPLFPA